ncbi:MAG: caspase family protein [Clostridium sp.]|nr:caspase family protein [Clostridium sp.]
MARNIALLLTIALCAVASMAQSTYLLSVGIADYKEINDLRLSENDAEDVAVLMRANGAEATVVKGADATHEGVILALRSILAKAKPEDSVVFYFSGHGYEGGFCCWDMATKSPSLNPGNAAKAGDAQRLNKANRYYGGLSYAELQVLFRNCRAGKKMIIADACFSGGLQKGNHLNASVQSAKKGELVFFLSSQPDETSLEFAGGRNGLFTEYLLKGLGGEADKNSDGVISLGELYGYVQGGVSEYAAKVPHSQHPVMWGRFKADMPVLKIK